MVNPPFVIACRPSKGMASGKLIKTLGFDRFPIAFFTNIPQYWPRRARARVCLGFFLAALIKGRVENSMARNSNLNAKVPTPEDD
jgi:hypothetical protein